MRWTSLLVLSAVLFAGCNEYGYRYEPRPQILASPIFADYHDRGSSVDILVDTDALQLKQIEIVRADGTVVEPTGIDFPRFKPALLAGTDDAVYGPDMAQGPTVAHFDKAAIGAGPWTVQANIVGVPPVTISVGGPGPSNR